MTKTNLTFKEAITNGELAYYYFLYEITQDFNCEKCVFKMVTIQQEMCSVTVSAATHTNRQLRTTKEASIDSVMLLKGEGLSFSLFLCYKF